MAEEFVSIAQPKFWVNPMPNKWFHVVQEKKAYETEIENVHLEDNPGYPAWQIIKYPWLI